MALGNYNANVNYVRIKDGKFYLGKDLDTSYSQLDGTITKMYYKDEEYDGQAQRKLIIVVTDDADYQLGINVDTANYSTLVSFLKGVDITKPITLYPKADVVVKDGKEITRRTILVSQEGKFAKSYFTKENNHGLPEWNIVKVGNKKVIDKTDFLDFLENFVQKEYISKLVSVKPTGTVAAETKPALSVSDNIEDDEETSNLPWD